MGLAATRADRSSQHKLLRLHQVRGDAPNNLPYDLAFLAIATALALAGALLLRQTRQPTPSPPSPPPGTLRLRADQFGRPPARVA